MQLLKYGTARFYYFKNGSGLFIYFSNKISIIQFRVGFYMKSLLQDSHMKSILEYLYDRLPQLRIKVMNDSDARQIKYNLRTCQLIGNILVFETISICFHFSISKTMSTIKH